jgi:hypothetical protein
VTVRHGKRGRTRAVPLDEDALDRRLGQGPAAGGQRAPAAVGRAPASRRER